jgi:hypothetical protein
MINFNRSHTVIKVLQNRTTSSISTVAKKAIVGRDAVIQKVTQIGVTQPGPVNLKIVFMSNVILLETVILNGSVAVRAVIESI